MFSKLWGRATDDLALKLMAVFVAALLWFLASNEQNPMVSAEISGVSIDIVGLQAGWTAVDVSPRAVVVTVRGRQNIVSRLNRGDVIARLDMEGTGQGTSHQSVSVVVPDGLTVSEIRPDSVLVSVDETVHRQIPVKAEIVGVPQSGFVVGDVLTRPTHVYVQGPRMRVDEVDSARVIMDVTGADSDLIRMLPVQIVTGHGEAVTGLTVVPQTIETEVAVARVPPSRNVPVLVVLAGAVGDGYVLTGVRSNPDYLMIRGQIDEIASVETKPVNVTGLTEDMVVSVPLSLPSGVTSGVSVVEVVVNVERVSQQTLTAIPVRVKNLHTSLRAASLPSTVAVLVLGPESRLAELNPGSISVVIDADGLGVGVYDVELQLILPDGLTGVCEPVSTQLTVTANDE